jgi:hypothetical protein
MEVHAFVRGAAVMRQFVFDYVAGLSAHLWRLQIWNTHPQQFLAAVAHDLTHARIDLEDFIVGVVNVDGVVGVFKDDAKAFLAFAQRLLRPLALDGVANGAGDGYPPAL